MKYFAILKDSFREAVDAKVLFVMLGLSALAILLVATITVKPMPAQRTMENLVSGSTNVFFNLRNPEKLAGKAKDGQGRNRGNPFEDMNFAEVFGIRPFKLKEVQVIRGEPDSPHSDYLLTLAAPVVDAEAARKQPEGMHQEIKKIFKTVEDLGLLKLGDIRLAAQQPELDPEAPTNPVVYEVETLATPTTNRLWVSEVTLFFGAVPLPDPMAMFFRDIPLGYRLYYLAGTVTGIGSWVMILTGVIITSFFIPNMLRKGTVDLLLVKPVRRWTLLVYKYVGGLTFVFLNNAFAITGIWLMLGLRTGIWANSFLLFILTLTFFFAILYAISTLFAVLTRSVVVSILVTCGSWFIFFLVGLVYTVFEQQARVEEALQTPQEQRWASNTFGQVIRVIHAVLPRTSDLNYLSDSFVQTDFQTGSLTGVALMSSANFSWAESLGVSFGFIAVMLGLACWRFSTRDY